MLRAFEHASNYVYSESAEPLFSAALLALDGTTLALEVGKLIYLIRIVLKMSLFQHDEINHFLLRLLLLLVEAKHGSLVTQDTCTRVLPTIQVIIIILFQL